MYNYTYKSYKLCIKYIKIIDFTDFQKMHHRWGEFNKCIFRWECFLACGKSASSQPGQKTPFLKIPKILKKQGGGILEYTRCLHGIYI